MFARPAACTWSRHGEMARMPRRTQASMMSGSGRSTPRLLRTVAVLIESQRWSWEKSRMGSGSGRRAALAPPLAQDRGVVEVAVTGVYGSAHQARVGFGKRQGLAGGLPRGQHQVHVLQV